ncbi:MAG: uracil-DNA glycosylase [Thermomicrobiales bacterium]
MTLTVEEKANALAEIAAGIKVCTRCELHRTRTQSVPGEGPPDARVMLIGEAPGWNEDQQGRPFVGAAGKFLEELLAKAGLTRSEVFINNIVKSRPPGNRDPLPDEIAACVPWLERQIEVIDPDVIVTLGRFSMAQWFPGERISRIHGQPKQVGRRLIVPMYHPAAALHQQALRATIEEDFGRLPRFLAEVANRRDEGPEDQEPPAQMSLF